MKRVLNKGLAWALAVCMVFTLLPATALAADTYDGITVDGGTAATDYSWNETSKTLTILTDTALTLFGMATDAQILVAGTTEANLTLNGLSIDNTGENNDAPIKLTETATLNLTLADGSENTLDTHYLNSGSPDIYYARADAIHVPLGTALTIGGTGTLTAKSGRYYAAIGSGDGPCGNITINNGIVNAYAYGTGNYNGGVGVGGIIQSDSTSGTSQITINGGTVTAYGDMAGIGCYDITYNNYTKSGVPNEYNIIITGGIVNAYGIPYSDGVDPTNASSTYLSSVGIGGDAVGAPGVRNIEISGGTVTAYGSVAGIGGNFDDDYEGASTNPLNIKLTGGTVIAKGFDNNKISIGGYMRSTDHRTIEISGTASVNETGYTNAGAIGGSDNSNGSIIIKGSAVINNACAIGSTGYDYDTYSGYAGGTIQILENASVGGDAYYEAIGHIGGSDSSNGSGTGGAGGDITINTTGTVNATSIGGGTGNNGGDGGTITMINGTVKTYHIGGGDGKNSDGTGTGGDGGNIAISGGQVGEYSGGGDTPTGSTNKLSGSGANAHYYSAAGIGGGGGTQLGGSGGTINISGGTVYAIAGVTVYNPTTGATATSGTGVGGAGIGGGNGASGGAIHISGGCVEVTSVNVSPSEATTATTAPALIGGGSAGGAGEITISGGRVTASVSPHNVPLYGSGSTVLGQGMGATEAGGWVKVTGGILSVPSNKYADAPNTTKPNPLPSPWPTSDGSTKVYMATLDLNQYYVTNWPSESLNLSGCTITSMVLKEKSSGQTYSYGTKDMIYSGYIWLPASTMGVLYDITLKVKKDNTVYKFSGSVTYASNSNMIGSVVGSSQLQYDGEETNGIQLTSDWGSLTKTYSGANQMPTFTVKNTNGDTLTEGTDYTVEIKYAAGGFGSDTGVTVTEMKNAGDYKITATGKTGTAYQDMTSTSDELRINAKEITATLSTPATFTKQYDGTTDVYSGGVKVESIALTVDSGLCAGETLTGIVAQNPRYATSGVGTGVTIDTNSPSYTYTQGGQPSNLYNYTIKLPSDLKGDITVKVIGESNLSASGVTVSKVYDGTTSCALTNVTGNVTLKDLVGTEIATVNITGVTGFDSKDVGTTHTVTLTIGNLTGANAANYTLGGGATTVGLSNAKITAADYTYNLTAEQQAQDFSQGGGIAQISLPQTAAGVNGVSVETVTGTVTLWHDAACTAQQADNSSVNALGVGQHNLYVKFVPAPPETNYTTKVTTGKVVVLTVVEGDPQVVSFATPDAMNKTYGDSAFTNAATNSSPGCGAFTYTSGNTSVATVDANTGEATIVGAGTAVITATAPKVEGVYRATAVSYTLTVNKKAITVTAENKTKPYGTANPTLTFTHTPGDLVVGDTVSALGVTLACAATTASPAGTPVAITGTAVSANYAVTVTPGTLTITKANQTQPTLSLSSATAVKTLAAPTLTASGGNGTGAYSYAGGDAGIATVNASTGAVTIVGAGTTTFTVTKAADTNYNASAASAAVTLTVSDKVALTVRDTAATDAALIAHLQNQGDITVAAITRVGLANEFTVAVTGKSALTAYASSNVAQGTGNWIGLLIGNLQVNDAAAADLTGLYYKAAAGGTYAQLTGTDATEASQVGGTAKELVLWIKSDVTPTKTIWLATSATGANETKLTINFTAYTAPPSGNNGGAATASTPSNPATTNSGSTTTVSTTVNATSNSAGKASAAVAESAVTKLIDGAKTAEKSNQSAVIELKVDTPSAAKDMEVTIPKASFDGIADKTSADLKISTGLGEVTFDAKAIGTISDAANSGNIAVQIHSVAADTLSESARAIIGDRPVYDFSVYAGTTQVSDFQGGTASLSVPYSLKAGEDKNAVVVYYIDDSGSMQTVRGAYNVKTGMVDFTVSHFSTYAVGYNKIAFSDVSTAAWYADAVTFVSARGITAGTSASTFSPNAAITRGQFLVMLMRGFQIEPDKTSTENFADAGNTYYTNYLATAKRLGITTGVGDNLFKPNATITRQGMFTLLYNALQVMGELPEQTKTTSISEFADAAYVSDYAKNAMQALVNCGIVGGSNGALNPTGSATRAQMAQLMLNLLS